MFVAHTVAGVDLEVWASGDPDEPHALELTAADDETGTMLECSCGWQAETDAYSVTLDALIAINAEHIRGRLPFVPRPPREPAAPRPGSIGAMLADPELARRRLAQLVEHRAIADRIFNASERRGAVVEFEVVDDAAPAPSVRKWPGAPADLIARWVSEQGGPPMSPAVAEAVTQAVDAVNARGYEPTYGTAPWGNPAADVLGDLKRTYARWRAADDWLIGSLNLPDPPRAPFIITNVD